MGWRNSLTSSSGESLSRSTQFTTDRTGNLVSAITGPPPHSGTQLAAECRHVEHDPVSSPRMMGKILARWKSSVPTRTSSQAVIPVQLPQIVTQRRPPHSGRGQRRTPAPRPCRYGRGSCRFSSGAPSRSRDCRTSPGRCWPALSPQYPQATQHGSPMTVRRYGRGNCQAADRSTLS